MQNKKEMDKIKFKDWFSRNIKVVAILLVIIILAFSYFFLLSPLYKKIRQSGQVSLASKTQYLKALEQHLRDLQKLQDNFNHLNNSEKDSLANLNFILPTKKDLPGLFVQLEKIATDNGLILSNIDISEQRTEGLAGQPVKPSTISDKIKKLNIAMTLIEGNYKDLLGFLDALEYNLRLMDVASISFAGGDEKSVYTVNLTTYYLVE